MNPTIIDKAPGNELISRIIENKSFDDFSQFYKVRSDWGRGPLIPYRMFTYGLFDDLVDSLPQDKELISALLDYAIKIANDEKDKRFSISIFMILELCKLGLCLHLPTKEQVSLICKLRERVQKLSVQANLACFWNSILDYCNGDDRNFKKKPFLVDDDDYLFTLDIKEPYVSDFLPEPCPVSMDEILKEVDGVVGKYKKPEFIRTLMIEKDIYWAWDFKNISGNEWDYFLIVRQRENGETLIRKRSYPTGIERDITQVLCELHCS